MRYLVRFLAVGCAAVGLWAATSAAQAGLREDCEFNNDFDLIIRACDELIRRNPRDAVAHRNRGGAYGFKKDYTRATADYREALRLNPNDIKAYHDRAHMCLFHSRDFDCTIADYSEVIRRKLSNAPAFEYSGRGLANVYRGEYDRAIADFTKAIALEPQGSSHSHYEYRGDAYRAKGDYDRAIADLNNAGYARARSIRGRAYHAKGDYERAIAEFNLAIAQDTAYPNEKAPYYAHRGNAYRAKGDHDRAIADLNEAIKINPNLALAYRLRGRMYEAMGDHAKAIEDYAKALAIPGAAWNKEEGDEQAEAKRRLTALQTAPPPPAPAPVPPSAKKPPVATVAPPPVAPPASPPPGRRVALVIGNASYKAVPKLPNPLNDAREIAAALRAAAFSEVIERYDLGVKDMQRALSAFEDKAAAADWALVYYAGHGIEVDGRNYLIPVDAELKRASDVEDETVGLDRVLARVAVARKLQLVILDACRDNPFASRMAQVAGNTRSIGTRGLARIEPKRPNLIVAYSAQDGQVALDG